MKYIAQIRARNGRLLFHATARDRRASKRQEIGTMALWPKGAKAFIRKGWGYWVGQDFRRAQVDLHGTIDIEVPGYVFLNLDDGRRVKADKRSVQIKEAGHGAT